MVAPLLWELRFLIAAGAAVSFLLLRGDSGEVCFSGRFVSFGLLLWVGLSSFSAIGGRWIVPAVSFGSGVPVATTADFVPVVSSLVDGGGRRGWGMLFVSAVGLASSGGLVSFYFRVSGSVAGCGGSFPSPVSMMADLLGVLFFSSVAERRRRQTQERSFSTSPAGVLVAILLASVLEFVVGCLLVHAECLSVQSFIRSDI